MGGKKVCGIACLLTLAEKNSKAAVRVLSSEVEEESKRGLGAHKGHWLCKISDKGGGNATVVAVGRVNEDNDVVESQRV